MANPNEEETPTNYTTAPQPPHAKQGKRMPRNNNFDLLRILAALQVAILHAAAHMGVERGPILTALTALPGVPIFFVISGFLISQSFERTDLRTYCINRALRIFPAMWGCLAVSVVVAGALGDVSFNRIEVIPWLVAQVTFGQFYAPDFLRGFGTGVLNGPLWTITVELQFYAVLPLLYMIFSRRRGALPLLIIGLILVNRAFAHWENQSEGFAVQSVRMTVLPYLYMFLIGVFLQRNREIMNRYIIGRLPVWLTIFCAATLVLRTMGFRTGGNLLNPLSATLLALVIISAAHTRPIRLPYDISYGLYLYHMVVINALVHVGKSGYTWIVAAILVSVLFAVLSWILVERPALKLKHSFSPRKHHDTRIITTLPFR